MVLDNLKISIVEMVELLGLVDIWEVIKNK